MRKNEFLTPKAIANRIKAKGLQKMRWCCQMCQKQCRDENGFKCHCMSESHQRQMQVFGQNPTRIISGYSEEFESMFLEHMKRSHCFSRHRRLQRAGKLKVEETPKGWFITYIDNDLETLFKERMKNKRLKAGMVEEEKMEREIQKQIERAEQMVGSDKGGEEEGLAKS
ncbi:hypothetical protein SASPL_147563 [Salvia splendens]|uniref:DNA/RNA-binding protein Kin17 WH-like domain-containing protein n=1 Tax=Salvia splendens TaxID=180675 RepID=A0A8X8WFV4_SALSN|nr:hypothetical protein SASPL_147563 [Salvia splendens]